MLTFDTASYQIESGKWIPEGYYWMPTKGVSSYTLKRETFHDKPCATEKEANEIITNYFLKRGYIAGKIERK